MSESGKVVVTKSKLDGLANAINDKAKSPGPKTIAQLTQTVNDIKTADPSTTTPLAPTAAGAVGTSTEYARGDHRHPKELPNVTTADNGKFLRVVSGAWAAVEIANANGGSF